MAWMHSHRNAYRKSRNSRFFFPWFPPPWSTHAYEVGCPSAFHAQHSAWQESPYIASHLESSRQSPHDCSRTRASTIEMKHCVTRKGRGQSQVTEQSVTRATWKSQEELRQYFAETERHREEQRRQWQLDEEHLDGYVNADHGLYYNHCQSVEPLAERPGAQRQAEMKCSYGDSAAKILAMEAAIQLSFDKKYDRKQPKYWPVIPLKF